MLYSLLAAVLILSFFMAIIVPYCVIQAFLSGYNLIAKEEGKPSLMFFNNFKRQKKRDKELEKKKERESLILENIENYQGNSLGQKVVK